MNLEKRKIINHELSKGSSAKAIGELIYCDPTAVSKEIRRNRHLVKDARCKDGICKLTLRFPYVCNGCHKKYSCPKKIYEYSPTKAQKIADYNLVAKRRGINLTPDEFNELDRKIKDGIEDGKSIYEIVVGDKDIFVSVPTVYRYIDKKILTTRKIDLPVASKLKKRKKKNKEYDYPSNSKIDRSNRTYDDFLVFKFNNPNAYTVEMDFLGSKQTDVNSILTLVWPDLHFLFMRNIYKKNGTKIVRFFNQLEDYLGIENFQKLFPCVLTDRDPSFAFFDLLEINNSTGELRTRMFYCDAFKSNEKPSVENMNKQLRRYFPKGSSVNDVGHNKLVAISRAINSRRKKSLQSSRPDEVFAKIYGEDILEKMYSFIFIDEDLEK